MHPTRYRQPQPYKHNMNVCLTCGHRGDSKLLIYCIQCKACAEHSYCLEKIHRNEDGKVIWRCEDCTPNIPKCKPEPSRKSERISYATEAKYKRMIMKKKSCAFRKQTLFRSNEGESVGCLAKKETGKVLRTLENENVLCKQPESPKVNETEKVLPTLENENVLRKHPESPKVNETEKVLPTLENENVLCKQPESPKVNETDKVLPTLENENVLLKQPDSPKVKDPSNISYGKQAMDCEIYAESEVLSTMPQFLHYPEFDEHSRAQPLRDPIWTGQFRLNNATHFHLVAYMSSKASPKFKLAVTELPKVFDVEMLPRRVIWPQSFDVHPPNSDDIALYFVPQYASDERNFNRVLNEAIEQDKALKVVSNNLNIFIFSSHLLPPDDRRISQKYYLWSVFKPKPRK
ncbi:uncharacterized protein LOC123916594 isoform X1 [Trifolium pratense]|uniref:uncharacterized protein LOC123916594 isoform X1 n=2 Tax=Trifolium pratense TaxID=57577 RepID=UPI001E695516|nr:uncharacterized protein LOC123916594 isoform X1 [Trifolium pratense]